MLYYTTLCLSTGFRALYNLIVYTFSWILTYLSLSLIKLPYFHFIFLANEVNKHLFIFFLIKLLAHFLISFENFTNKYNRKK